MLTRNLVANKISCYRTYKRGQAQSPEQNGNQGGKETPGCAQGVGVDALSQTCSSGINTAVCTAVCGGLAAWVPFAFKTSQRVFTSYTTPVSLAQLLLIFFSRKNNNIILFPELCARIVSSGTVKGGQVGKHPSQCCPCDSCPLLIDTAILPRNPLWLCHQRIPNKAFQKKNEKKRYCCFFL